MAWPSAQDYFEAVQNPRNCFAAPELRESSPVTTPLGLPKVVAGQFACVFRLEARNTTWAVRCFLSEIPDQQERYAAISRVLESASFPCFVPFKYLSQGIRVKGGWYPILQMQWVRGVLLHDYVRDHLDDPSALRSLITRFGEVSAILQKSGVAHGDLQHGNILIVDGRPVLIDYDGMFVGALSGKCGLEIGHRNYQHPGRTEFSFDSTLDQFSLWVICASLAALAVKPTLWTDLDGGDDALLFRARDFKEPLSSPALSRLRECGEPELSGIAQLVEDLASSDYFALPPFSADALGRARPNSIAVNRGRSTTLPDWLTPVREEGSIPVEDGASWLTDHVVVDIPSSPIHYPRRVRQIAAGIAISILLAPILHYFYALTSIVAATLSVMGSLIGLFLLLDLHRNDPSTKAAQKAREELRGAEEAYRAKFSELKRAEASLQVLESSVAERVEENSRETARLEQHCEDQVEKLKVGLDIDLRNKAAEKANAIAAVSMNQNACQRKWSGSIDPIKAEIQSLIIHKDKELAAALQSIQDRHIEDYMNKFTIAGASIPGIGEKLTERLAQAGIRTAADAISSRLYSVSGIGAQKTGAIRKWLKGIEAKALSTLPKSLPPHVVKQVEAALNAKVAMKQRQLDDVTRSFQSELSAISGNSITKVQAIETEMATLRRKFSQFVEDLRTKTTAAIATADSNLKIELNNSRTAIFAQREQLTTMRAEMQSLAYARGIAQKRVSLLRATTFLGWFRKLLLSS